MKKFNVARILFLLEIALTIFLWLVNWSFDAYWHWANIAQPGSDSATFVVTAIAHRQGLGIPYRDYWEYRPPGFYFLLDFWTSLFGTNILSFRWLEALTRLFIGFQICFITRKLFSPFQAFVVTTLTLFVIFSPVFGSFLYPEPFGIFFSLLGLLSLLYVQRPSLRLFLAAFCFSTATQLKDSFGGVILALAPSLFLVFNRHHLRQFTKAVISLLSGYLLPIFIFLLYLVSLGSFSAYLGVLKHKASLYPVSPWDIEVFKGYVGYFVHSKNYISFFPRFFTLGATFLLVIVFISWVKNLLLKGGPAKLKTNLKKLIKVFAKNQRLVSLVTVLFYSAGSYFGPSRMGLISPHYVFFVIFPTYILWSIAASLIVAHLKLNFKRLNTDLVFVLLIFLLLFPRDWVTELYQKVPTNPLPSISSNLTTKEADMGLEKYINSKTTSKDCVLSLYGWKSSDTYLYAQRRPCTRFIIPNLVNFEWQRQEYRQALIDNPPEAIVYSLGGADMDYRQFEREVINIPRLLDSCYQQDKNYTYTHVSETVAAQLYFPRFSDTKLKECVKKNAGWLDN